MSIKHKLRDALESLGTFAGKPVVTQAQHQAQALTCELSSLDRLGCALERLSLVDQQLDAADVGHLERICNRLAARLSYLLEPIRVLEVDAEQCAVQMRSVPPQQDDDGTTYYELLAARGGRLCLSRYRAVAGGERELVPAQLTREVLLRLADDFARAGQA